MMLTGTDIFVGLILLSCVPLQYVIVKNWGNSGPNRSYELNRIVTHVTKFYDEYLNLETWKQQFFKLLNISSVSYDNEFEDFGESPAVEVLKFKQNKGYFSLSTEPRTYRSPDVEFHVGQVIVHKTWKYRGVIIGWDEKARAPPEWLEDINKKNKMWKYMPNYAILVDTRDRLIPQLTYVPQANIKVVKGIKVFHPIIDNYFETYNGEQYVPRPWLRTLYPQD